MQAWPHPNGWIYASAEVCETRGAIIRQRNRCIIAHAQKLTRAAPTGLRRRSPTPADRRLDPPGPQMDCCILGLSGLLWGLDPTTRLHGSGELGGLVAPRCHLCVGTGLLAGILRYRYIHVLLEMSFIYTYIYM